MKTITVSREFGSGGRELGNVWQMFSVSLIMTKRSSAKLRKTLSWMNSISKTIWKEIYCELSVYLSV